MKAKSLTEIGEYLQNATKVLADGLHKAPKHELDCIKRLPMKMDEGLEEHKREVEENKRIWINMLRMLPGVSELRASAFAKKFSCPRMLFERSNRPTGPDYLLTMLDLQLQYQYDFEDVEGGKKQSSQKKLSKLVHKLATSLEADERIEVE